MFVGAWEQVISNRFLKVFTDLLIKSCGTTQNNSDLVSIRIYMVAMGAEEFTD